MPVTSFGIVYYQDDVTQTVFRRIFPTLDDSEIANELCPCGCGDLHWRGHLDPTRTAVLQVTSNGTAVPNPSGSVANTAAQAIDSVAATSPPVVAAGQAAAAAQLAAGKVGATAIVKAQAAAAQTKAAAVLAAAQSAARTAAARPGATAQTIVEAAQTAGAHPVNSVV